MKCANVSASIRCGLIAVAAVIGVACQQTAPVATAPAAPTHEEIVARGQYLVAIGSCNECHTPLKMGPNGPEPDMARMLSGHPEGAKVPPAPKLSMDGWAFAGTLTNTAWAGPWGISYVANITPDQNTGIGIWDEGMFIKAMRTGRHMGDGRPIVPPMPWPWIAKMTDDDLKAVFAYLKSIPPVANRVPDYVEPPAHP